MEVMIVVVIISILASIAIQHYGGQAERARIEATKASMRSIDTALGSFEVRAGRYPTTEEGLAALKVKPADLTEDQWSGTHFKTLPVDGWKEPFIYICPGKDDADYDLFSKGKDKKENTEDDIREVE